MCIRDRPRAARTAKAVFPKLTDASLCVNNILSAGITPATIIKQVADVMESAHPAPNTARGRAADKRGVYEVMTPEQLLKKAAKLEKKMLRHARDLEFEEAAKLRDEIQHLRSTAFGIPDSDAG